MRYLIVATIIAAQLYISPGNAQEDGNSSAGLAYVRANCAECHAVEKDDEFSPNFAAPSFGSVAAAPGVTGFAIAAWLRTPHHKMPNFIISPEDQINIIAYILDLKPPPAQ